MRDKKGLMIISVFIITTLLIILGACDRINQTRKVITDLVQTIEVSDKIKMIAEEGEALTEQIPEDELEKIIDLGSYAVENAKKIDHELLNKIYPDLGDKFQENLVVGIDLILKGYRGKNDDITQEGKELIESWGEWFDTNLEKIKLLSFLRE